MISFNSAPNPHRLTTRTRFLTLLLVVMSVWMVACADENNNTNNPTDSDALSDTSNPADTSHVPTDPGQPAEVLLPAEQQEALAALRSQLSTADGATFDSLAPQYALPFQTLPYDPSTAAGLPLIQEAFALNDAERAALSARGFLISERTKFPSFVYGYESLYMHDLPLYISADSILNAVHRSYDDMLKALEEQVLIPDLRALLQTMRDRLDDAEFADLPAQAKIDADLYLAVALSLLDNSPVAAVAGADSAQITDLAQKGDAADGTAFVHLFGAERELDFSQFTPRGHYTDSEELTRYFKAMMWLGRTELRMIETQPDGTQKFYRRQVEGALALTKLLDLTRWGRIDNAVRAFVGESDNMTPTQFDSLFEDLGVSTVAEFLALDDETLSQAIIAGRYGEQLIASQLMTNGTGETLPLSAVFLIFGQRYVVDSHVFSNVVFDRVAGGSVKRMMPNPLDVAFAALGNNQAFGLLESEQRNYAYTPDLQKMRLLVDAHGADHWSMNLYNLWLGSLRALSPRADLIAAPGEAGLPAVAATEAWGRRLLNTQLASWAELRHDTILYVKQSYTSGATCEFPDAYIDPYPEAFAQLTQFADEGAALIQTLNFGNATYLQERFVTYFAQLREVTSMLEAMAEQQRNGTPFTAEQMAFINQAVAIQMGCGDPAGVEGWYANLFFNPVNGVAFDPTIADVHTQPTDEGGSPVGRVLHVGTGMPRLMVVTVDTCSGPRAYAGLASSYFEVVTEDFDRLDDIRWSEQLGQTTPADVPWMQDLVVR